MTTWLWALQILWNLTSLLLVAWIWFYYRRAALVGNRERESSILSEASAGELSMAMERELEAYRTRVALHLAQLAKIAEEAKAIVDRAKSRVVTFSQSQEESELLAAANPDAIVVKKGGPIPTLEQVERSKHRLNADLGLDLKSLLKDQLV